MSDKHPQTACIIGGGMSGLITGALLAKNGYKVTVLEKNHIIGGGLQSFRRGDAVFNTGMQVLCGYDYAFKHFINYLELNKSNLDFSPVDFNAQEIIYLDEEHVYHLPKTRDRYETYLISHFPNQAEGIHQLLDAIYEIGSFYDGFWPHTMNYHPAAVKYAMMSAKQLIEKHTSDNELRRLFEYAGMHVGHNLTFISALDFGMILNLYIDGGWRIAGGNITLASELAESIKHKGGLIYNDCEVTKVHVTNKKISCIETVDGRQFVADIYVCAIPPKVFLSMTDGDVFRLSTKERIVNDPNDISANICHIKLKHNQIKYSNSCIFIATEVKDDALPIYTSILTPPSHNHGEWAETLEILEFTRSRYFEEWAKTKTGNRGEKYELKKKEIGRQMVDRASVYYPNLEDATEKIYIATPLTIRDFYANPNGAVYGQHGLNIPIKTKLENLYMTGQAVRFNGLYGMAVTAQMTAETILGKSLIDEIANA